MDWRPKLCFAMPPMREACATEYHGIRRLPVSLKNASGRPVAGATSSVSSIQRSSASRSSWSVLAWSKDSASKGQIAHGPQNHSNRAPQTRVLRFHLEAREITRPRGACAAFPYLMHILLQSRYVNARNKGDLVDDVAVSGNFSEFVWTRCTGSAGFVLSHRGHREFFCRG